MRAAGRAFLLLVLILAAAPATAQIPPDARWRTFDTPNFRITFADGLEPTARRAAAGAERAYALLARELVDPPRGRIDLVVADNVDLANGSATPIPTNRIIIYAHPPVDEPSLAYYDDWLQLVILHELVHVFHLDHAEGLWEGLRMVFGRSPALFPHLFSPGWLVEGLATAYESRFTTAGRVRGTMHDMILRTAVLEDHLFTIDRATAEPIRWPAGSTRYVYGGFFLDHLARTYGQDRVTAFVREYGGRLVPYRLDSAAREAFGTSFTTEWRAWTDSLRVRYGALADSLSARGLTEPEMLTRHGRAAFHPRFAPGGQAIAYAAATGTDEPAVRVIGLGGRLLASARASSIGPSAWMPDGSRLLTSRLEHVDPYRIFSDLRIVGLDGEGETITRRARLSEPDLHPDGRMVVAVANAGGTNVLALHDIVSGSTRVITPPELDVHWSLPRWSPDGALIAVSRWSTGGLYDVVVVDTTGSIVRELTSDRAVDAAPAWSPDGRYIVFSSDRTGIPNLHAYDRTEGTIRQVTNLLTGASHPDVSPDGRWIAFAVYGADGWDIGRIPFKPGAWRGADAGGLEREVGARAGVESTVMDSVGVESRAVDPKPGEPRAAEPTGVGPEGEGGEGAQGGPVRDYSAFPTVLPAAWSLALGAGGDLGLGIGAAAFGWDVVARHRWGAEAVVYPRDTRVTAGASYRYRGLGLPVLDVTGAQVWGVRVASGQVVVGGEIIASGILERERSVRAGAGWIRPRWGSSAWLEADAGLSDVDLVWEDPDAAAGLELVDFPRDASAGLVAGYTSARSYGVSIGPQEGFTVSARAEGHRYLEPFAGEQQRRGYGRITGRGRGYFGLALPGFARHVLAFRADAGLEQGSSSPGFGAGGASGGAVPGPLEVDILGGGVAFPVRGYAAGTQHGNRAFAASGEYRFPIALVERGIGLVPLAIGRVWGDLFADAGSAWCAGAAGPADGATCFSRIGGATRPDPLVSVGAELVVHALVGFHAEIPIRVGAALPLRGDHGTRPSLHVRIGRSF